GEGVRGDCEVFSDTDVSRGVWMLKLVQHDKTKKVWIPAFAGMTGAGDRNEKAGGIFFTLFRTTKL
ncbi:MAG: hypothetical protein WBP23_02445, partial [Candidatus Saccharimonadales bacterium]